MSSGNFSERSVKISSSILRCIREFHTDYRQNFALCQFQVLGLDLLEEIPINLDTALEWEEKIGVEDVLVRVLPPLQQTYREFVICLNTGNTGKQ